MDRLLNVNDSINALFSEGESNKTAATPVNRTGKIHIRTQQQGKRWITTIEGLDDDLDQERIARAMKKAFHCAAKAVQSPDGAEIIMIQGNHRDDALEWLLAYEVISEKERKERVVLHGV
jgi:translation initiation factor SUI1